MNGLVQNGVPAWNDEQAWYGVPAVCDVPAAGDVFSLGERQEKYDCFPTVCAVRYDDLNFPLNCLNYYL
jgi:hypothetical protein